MAGPHFFSMYDAPFWASVAERGLKLQRCCDCGTMRYPPGPACPNCLSPDASWEAVNGAATLLSWTVFHRQYLPAYPAPHTVVAAQLAEGPIMIGTIIPDGATGLAVDAPVQLDYATHADGYVLPGFRMIAS